MESAAPGDKSQREGWLNRFLIAAGLLDPLPGRHDRESGRKGAARARGPTVAVSSVADFVLKGSYGAERSSALGRHLRGPDLRERIVLSAESCDGEHEQTRSRCLESLGPRRPPVTYPAGSLAMRWDVAAMIKGDIGLRVRP